MLFALTMPTLTLSILFSVVPGAILGQDRCQAQFLQFSNVPSTDNFQSPADGSTSATVASGDGYQIHIGGRSKIGDTETVHSHESITMQSVLGSSTRPLKQDYKLQEIDAVVRTRTVRIDADGNDMELRVFVKSATGRSMPGADMEPLTCDNTTLRVVRAPYITITRLDGHKIPAAEKKLWELVFGQIDPADKNKDADAGIPARLHLGDTWTTTADVLGLSPGEIRHPEQTTVETDVTGMKTLDGDPYLVLTSHSTALPNFDGYMTGKTTVLSSIADYDTEETVPTVSTDIVRGVTRSFKASVQGEVSGPGGMQFPLAFQFQSSDEHDVLAVLPPQQ